MARLGFRTVNEMVGRVDKLAPRKDVKHWKARHLRLDKLLQALGDGQEGGSYCCERQDHGLETALDWELMKVAKPALDAGTPVRGEFAIRNVNRTVGTILSSNISRKYGGEALPEDTIRFKFNGSAGQSFCASASRASPSNSRARPMTTSARGCRGQSHSLSAQGLEVHRPRKRDRGQRFPSMGPRAERPTFAARRVSASASGIRARDVVVESCGDHGCEYMTGGSAVVLGAIGRNFAAGMSGGVAYIHDPDGLNAARINTVMVDLEEVTGAEEAINLKERIERHFELTGSQPAKEILASWKANLPKFIKVMPKDYKRALAEMRAEVGTKG